MHAPAHLVFDDYRLDPANRELRDGAGAPVALTGKAFDVLLYLIAHRGRLVGKEELLAAIWPGRVVEDNNLTQAVSALRRALGTGAGDQRYVLTVPGHGYRFVAAVRETASPKDDAVSSQPAVGKPEPRFPTPSRRVVFMGGSLFAAALFAVAAWRLETPAPAPLRAPVPGDASATLAVFPFRSLGGDRDELLDLGLAETVIARVSGSTKLRVRSLASTRRSAGADRDPLDAARLLGAAYVVEGATQRSGDRVRVNARLLAVRDGSTLWSGTFDERIERVFTLQDGIATAVATALALKLDDATTARGRSPCDGADAEAYRAYLTGRHQLDRPSAARMRQALAAFRRAIDLDPTCARAYAGMAYAYRAAAMTGDQDPREIFPLAKAAVKQALAIDPDLAEAYASQGFIRFWHDWDWAGAEASFERAIALNPSLAEAHLAYALMLNNLSRFDEARQRVEQARELDPLSPLINTFEAWILANAGRGDAARRRLEQALALDPDFWIALLTRSGMALAEHDYAGAISDLRRARALSGDSTQVLMVLGEAHAQAGERAQTEQILRDLERRDRAGYVPATSLAALHNALGDTPRTLDLLEQGALQRDVRMSFLGIDRRWNNLRDQPRFRALMQRLHLEPDEGTDR